MKKLIYNMLLVFLFPISIFGQESYTPILKECETGSAQLDVKCTDLKIKEYFLLEIDTTLCPDSDNSKHYKLKFEVNDEGDFISSNLFSYNNETVCYEYLNNRATEFIRSHKAKNLENRKKITSKFKTLTFTYPPLDTFKNIPNLSFEELYSDYEVNPRFYNASCEGIIGSGSDKNECSQNEFLKYIYKNLKYPKKARRKGTQGYVIVQFVVDKHGKITDGVILKDIDNECGETVMELIMNLNQRKQPFIPGMQNGRKVSVKYTIPVRFQLTE